jgi:folate-binding Fe-S cluster repair protein YgfZ
MSAITMEELVQTGLCDASVEHHLTLKGRDMLRFLEDLETQEVVDQQEAAADLVLSTNGIFR